MVAIMGTSICDIALGDRLATVAGMCGVVEDGVVPGLFGYEAGQSAVGDIFAWFVENGVPPRYFERAAELGTDVHAVLGDEAASLLPGETGLLALDWWNGNRSVLVDADLRGLLVGITLATTAPQIYRALLEATAFGTRVIIDSFEQAGIPVHEVVACGGLPERNALLMQIYADVTGRRFTVAASKQTPALGSAIFAALAAGAYGSIVEASEHMTQPSEEEYLPDPARHEAYEPIYREYVALHDHFGRGGDDVMRRLKRIQLATVESRR